MKKERRSYPRATPKDLHIKVNPSLSINHITTVNAEILDISRTGIRIKLKEALPTDSNNKIKISMLLPDSGDPFSVVCQLKRQYSDTEYGLHYVSNNQLQESIDDMLFECIELKDSGFLIKSI